MGIKLGCVVLNGGFEADHVFHAVRPVLEQWQPRKVDCFVSHPALLEPLGDIIGTVVAVRSDPLPPGNSEIAEVLSSHFQTRCAALTVNDFYQSAGYQLWDGGRPRTGLHVERAADLAGERHVEYLEIPALAFEQLFDVSVKPYALLFEDVLAAALEGIDRRLVDRGELLDDPVAPSEPIDWSWNTANLMWPAGEVLARVKVYQSRHDS